MPPSDLIRLDKLLVDLGLATSRTEGQRLIEAGQVLVDGNKIDRPGRRFAPSDRIEVKDADGSFVSRGGLKLEAALNHFGVKPAGFFCLDIGISTGGFTDCLLQSGATHVVGIDVGHGQLHPRIANDSRVELFEGFNVRNIASHNFPRKFDLITIDVSFISVTLFIRSITQLLTNDGYVICLIKPQFEVGFGNLGKHGIVTDDRLREAARRNVHAAAESAGLSATGTMHSPITGGDGNREFVSLFRPSAISNMI